MIQLYKGAALVLLAFLFFHFENKTLKKVKTGTSHQN